MQLINVLIIFFCFNQTFGQVVTGNYVDYFGSRLEIKSDSTFKYRWNFDLISNWSNGKYSIFQDTIHFNVVSIFDTLKRIGKPDSLLLSIDEEPNVIDESFLINYISSNGQHSGNLPNKLYFKKNKLYYINDEGKLMTNKVEGMFGRKKYPTWYYKADE